MPSMRGACGATTRRLRTATAVAVSAVVLGVTVAGFLAERGVPVPGFVPTSLHGVCPFGGVATIGRLLGGGLFVPRTGTANLFALAASLGATLFIGAFFCGWLCPLGAVQEWVRSLGRKLTIYPKRTGLPFPGCRARALDRALGALRYLTLALILFATYRSFNLLFAAVDPFYALFHFWTGTAMPAALGVLAVTLLLSLFVHRPWCRWLCPFGAVQGLVQKIAPWKIRQDAQLCVSCGACDRACPMHVRIAGAKAVTDGRCNRCLACIAACPRPGALRLAGPRLLRARAPRAGARPLFSDARGLAAVVLVAFLAPLAAGAAYRAVGSAVEPRRVAQVVAAERSPREGETATTQGGATTPAVLAATADPEELLQSLSGSLSLGQAAALLRVEQRALLEALELPQGFDVSVRLRDLEEVEEQKTYRWVRERIEALLRGGGFTQASPRLREPCTPVAYVRITDQRSGGLT